MPQKKTDTQPLELQAVSAIYGALKDMEPTVQLRALRYAAEMLNLSFPTPERSVVQDDADSASSKHSIDVTSAGDAPTSSSSQSAEDAEGINSVALKWLKRSGIELSKLNELFSLGIDEIDLIAKRIPGKSKRERFRNVILLKGVAAYLSTGAARISGEQIKEASLHYNAYDAPNSARYLKEFSADIGGTKEAGFTLTPRGLASATELLKSLLQSKT